MFDRDYLKKAGEKDVKTVLDECKNIRSGHRHSSKGMTKDKSMKFVARFPASFMFHPEYGKYFDPQMDPHERKKGLMAILKKFPEFKVVDSV